MKNEEKHAFRTKRSQRIAQKRCENTLPVIKGGKTIDGFSKAYQKLIGYQQNK